MKRVVGFPSPASAHNSSPNRAARPLRSPLSNKGEERRTGHRETAPGTNDPLSANDRRFSLESNVLADTVQLGYTVDRIMI